ncbi:S1 family peptidase [Janthinobacterium agaricidamnosum]|uniref:S1 family peptidase n=1 Tax=Janthinobacterium agaricidamnosum TaxID=55508 RepID=UPI000AB1A835|nr:serine protease [Janthinobacterium agaricidamnosum]
MTFSRQIIKNTDHASLCSIFIRTICSTPNGDFSCGMATGFHYRDILNRTWLITNWHVLTGRRPDDPGFLLTNIPQSPYRIEVSYPGSTAGTFMPPVMLDLYQNGKPIWRQVGLELGIDLAGIPIELPDGATAPCVQDFTERDTDPLQPGIDVIIVGFPLEHSIDMPFPVWKRAMIASEPAYPVFGQIQTLLDTPGTPGMSGSPVYRISPGASVSRSQYEKIKEFKKDGKIDLDFFEKFDFTRIQSCLVLNLVGVYAGSTGKPGLDRLSLGRMILASNIDLMIMKGKPGINPFPPKYHQY